MIPTVPVSLSDVVARPTLTLAVALVDHIDVICDVMKSGTALTSELEPQKAANIVDRPRDRLEMFWVHAQRHSAEVVKVHAARDGSDVMLVGDPMSGTRRVVDRHRPITVGVGAASPEPATGGNGLAPTNESISDIEEKHSIGRSVPFEPLPVRIAEAMRLHPLALTVVHRAFQVLHVPHRSGYSAWRRDVARYIVDGRPMGTGE